MAEKQCPVCGCLKFYVRDPDDEFETCAFECRDGDIVFDPDTDEADRPDIQDGTETFCDKCAWHGEFRALKKS